MISSHTGAAGPGRSDPLRPQASPIGDAWHHRSADEVLAHLRSRASGLSAPEAAQRLAADGLNELAEGQRISPLQIFLGQFKSLIIWILIAAGVISGALGEVVKWSGTPGGKTQP
jgi:P-type Ca2+ transporter type 2C